MMLYETLWTDFYKFMTEPIVNFDDITIANVFTNETLKEINKYLNENPKDYEFFAINLLNSLEKFDNYKASSISLFLGTMLEKNVFMKPVDKIMLLEFFSKSVELCKQLFDDLRNDYIKDIEHDDISDKISNELEQNSKNVFEKYPDNYKAYAGGTEIVPAIMAFICREFELRELLRHKENLYYNLRVVEEIRDEFNYVIRVLEMCEEENILVIHPKHKKGVEIKATQIENNFTLFSLLQKALLAENKLKDFGMDIKNIDKNKAIFDYYTYKALQEDESLVFVSNSKVIAENFVWGEASLFSVSKFIDKCIILITETSFNRSWDENFTITPHTEIIPNVAILRDIDEDECIEILNYIKEENKKLK